MKKIIKIEKPFFSLQHNLRFTLMDKLNYREKRGKKTPLNIFYMSTIEDESINIDILYPLIFKINCFICTMCIKACGNFFYVALNKWGFVRDRNNVNDRSKNCIK